MQLGEKIGKEKLYEYIKKFGFGNVVGVDLPGEASGIVKKPENISITDLATISFGQTNTVNSVQYMAAFNTLANGGTWIQPHVMKEISHDENGTKVIDESFNPITKALAKSENTAELRGYLERVVTAGSAKNTFLEGYHIGGKTGTAQKVINGVYAEGKYISSFVGMAPVDDPKVTIMITVDEPGTGAYYAGLVAVPYAKILFTDMFNYLDSKFSKENENYISKDIVIPEIRGLKLSDAEKKLKDLKLDYEVEGDGSTVMTSTPYPGYVVKEGSKIKLNTTGDSSESVIMPSVLGYSLQDAKSLLDSLGIKYSISGEGIVSDQGIPQGELIQKGTTVRVELSADYKD
jgi:stage V sporulation protein D (sporulation-specific penicillin-binding protein)